MTFHQNDDLHKAYQVQCDEENCEKLFRTVQGLRLHISKFRINKSGLIDRVEF